MKIFLLLSITIQVVLSEDVSSTGSDVSASTHDEMMKSTPENIDFTGFGTGLGNESMPPTDMPGPKPTRKPMPKPDMGCMGGLKDMDMESFRLKMAMGKMCPPCKNILKGPKAGSYKLESAMEPACDDGCLYSRNGVYYCFEQKESSEEMEDGYPTQECGKLNDKMIKKLMENLQHKEDESEESSSSSEEDEEEEEKIEVTYTTDGTRPTKHPSPMSTTGDGATGTIHHSSTVPPLR